MKNHVEQSFVEKVEMALVKTLLVTTILFFPFVLYALFSLAWR